MLYTYSIMIIIVDMMVYHDLSGKKGDFQVDVYMRRHDLWELFFIDFGSGFLANGS